MRMKAVNILKDLLPELQEENDDEWSNYILDEIAREVNTITDATSLFAVIGQYIFPVTSLFAVISQSISAIHTSAKLRVEEGQEILPTRLSILLTMLQEIKCQCYRRM